MKEKITKLQKYITPNTIGVIWTTPELLIDKPSPYTSLDYFWDGLLTSLNSRQQDKSRRSKSVFITNNFGKAIFLCHIPTVSNFSDSISEIISIADSLKNTNAKSNILLISCEKSDHNTLVKSFKQFDFIQFQ